MRTETYTIPEQTITEEIYEYDELDEDAKDIVKEWLEEQSQDIDELDDMLEEDIHNDFPNSQLQMDYEFNGYRSDDYFRLLGKLNLYDVVTDLKDSGIISSDEYDMIRYCLNRYEYTVSVDLEAADSYEESISNNIENVIWYLRQEYDKGNQPVFDDPTVPEASSEDVLIDTLNEFSQLCIDYLYDFMDRETEVGTEFFEDIDDEKAREICDTEGYEFDEDGNLYR